MAAESDTRVHVKLSWTDADGQPRIVSEALIRTEDKSALALGRRGDIVIKGAGIDDKHALIRLDSKGSCYIMDNGSETGTSFSADGATFVSIGSRAMTRSERKHLGRELHANCVIRIGDRSIRVEEVDEATKVLVNRQLVLQVVRQGSADDASDDGRFVMLFKKLTIGRRSQDKPRSGNLYMVVDDVEKRVSKKHCELLLAHTHTVYDCSTHGTFVKRGPLARDQVFDPEGWSKVCKGGEPLRPGDALRLADSVHIVVLSPSAEGHAPAAPSDLRLVDRTPTTLRLEWTPPAAEVVAYRLLAKHRESDLWSACWVGNSTGYEVQELEPGSEHSFSVCAQGATGFSEPSEVLVARTAPASAIDGDETASQCTVVHDTSALGSSRDDSLSGAPDQ
eukprot:Amastigsp_a510770_12.p1 type:complete len:393 gc:universal Amastigsp_a510770_12:79-1257(+)